MDISYKHIEPIILKYNNFLIPLYIEILEKHKYNIEKYDNFNDYAKLNKELINSKTTISQLKHELKELDELKHKISKKDVEILEQNIKPIMEHTSMTILSFEQFLQNLKLHSFNENVNQEKEANETMLLLAQPLDDSEIYIDILKENEKQLTNLQNDLKDLNQLFVQVSNIVDSGHEKLSSTEKNLAMSEIKTHTGITNLAQAMKYKGTIYPIAGAIIGSCIGGPVGLIFGLKIGGLAALSGAIVGVSSGSIFKQIKKKKSKSLHNIINSDDSAAKEHTE